MKHRIASATYIFVLHNVMRAHIVSACALSVVWQEQCDGVPEYLITKNMLKREKQQ